MTAPGDQRVGIRAGNELGEVHLCLVVADQEHVAVGQPLEIVAIGHITIARRDGSRGIVVVIEQLVDDIAATGVGIGVKQLAVMQLAVRQAA